jgi:hypothetical protein
MNTSYRKVYPRIRDLPESERKPFEDWLLGQTVPFIQDTAIMEQDGYYPSHYARWKAGLPIID